MTLAEEKLRKLASKESSNWVERAEWRITNENWLDKSQRIALAIILFLKEKGITQKELAETMNISPQQINKILKGNENLTLETISKFEAVLGITLIEIPGLQTKVIVDSELPIEYVKTEGNSVQFKYNDILKLVKCPLSIAETDKMKKVA